MGTTNANQLERSPMVTIFTVQFVCVIVTIRNNKSKLGEDK